MLEWTRDVYRLIVEGCSIGFMLEPVQASYERGLTSSCVQYKEKYIRPIDVLYTGCQVHKAMHGLGLWIQDSRMSADVSRPIKGHK